MDRYVLKTLGWLNAALLPTLNAPDNPWMEYAMTWSADIGSLLAVIITVCTILVGAPWVLKATFQLRTDAKSNHEKLEAALAAECAAREQGDKNIIVEFKEALKEESEARHRENEKIHKHLTSIREEMKTEAQQNRLELSRSNQTLANVAADLSWVCGNLGKNPRMRAQIED